jgi:predicted RNase H-like HicB family nuclease
MTTEERVAEVLARPYSFIAVADREDGGWVIFYPDLPGVITQADTYEEVARMAKDALEAWVEFQIEENRPIPEPTFDANPNWDWDTVRSASEIPTMTSEEAAQQLGISRPRVHQLARARGLGEMRGNVRMFSAKDVEALRERKPGRPPRPVASAS